MVCLADFLLPVVLVFSDEIPESALAKWPCWCWCWWSTSWCWWPPPCCNSWRSRGRPLISITRLTGRWLFGLDDWILADRPAGAPSFASPPRRAPVCPPLLSLLPPSLNFGGPLKRLLWSSSVLLGLLPSLLITTTSSPLLLEFSCSSSLILLTDILSSFSSFFSSDSLLSQTPEQADSQSVASIWGPRPKSDETEVLNISRWTWGMLVAEVMVVMMLPL